MYTISDAVEIGKAQNLILDSSKVPPLQDDINPQSQTAEEAFDE